MKYSSKPVVEIIVGRLLQSEITDIVISPGSRNAPFIQSFTSKSEFDCYSVVDERSAGFFALGMALKKQKPVVLLCTSGSALLNYYPAIAEAFYQKIPLIVLSADRPEYCIDQGQGQTIRQNGVLDLHIRKHLKLNGDESKANALINIEKQLFDAFSEINTISKLPIHLNVHLEEPLYDLIENFSFEFSQNVNTSSQKVNTFSKKHLDLWNKSEKKLFIIGQHIPDSKLESLLSKLSLRSDVLILTETTSNLNLEKGIDCIDAFLEGVKNFKENLRPDLLIQSGGAIISKKIKALLKDFQIENVWSYQEDNIHPDIYFSITEKFDQTLESVLEDLLTTSESSNKYSNFFQEKYSAVKHKRAQFIENPNYSDFHIYNHLLRSLPPETIIHSSNSSVIRYLQLFSHHNKTFYCNRGTSGIDGSTSTAIGFASQTDKPVCLITGDISFFYDSNAFWNNYIPKHFKVILINNGGGDIFRIIPGAKDSKARETYFSTAHELRAKGISETFGLDYYFCNNQQDFEQELKAFNLNSNPSILEIKIPEEVGPLGLKNFFEFIQN